MFNHPTTVATDGTHLLVTDRFNNRVLIWNTLPTSEADAPSLVLGQETFDTNAPGQGRDGLNWPGQVSVSATGKVAVADTYNNRILIWTTFPSRNKQPADLVISDVFWPWGVWTDGQKLAATATSGSELLVWNSFPTADNQAPSFRSKAAGAFGTPRTISSDGTRLLVGDHNVVPSGLIKTHVWLTFPTGDSPADYQMTIPDRQFSESGWVGGDFTRDGQFVAFGRWLNVWPSFPTSDAVAPSLIVKSFAFIAGEGNVAIAGNRAYVANYNGNRVYGYRTIPTTNVDPDFVIGADDVCTNTFFTNFQLMGAVPVSNGRSLMAFSPGDRRLELYRDMPDESNARPDALLTVPPQLNAGDVWGDTWVLGGESTIYVWRSFPGNGELPAQTFTTRIGSASLVNVSGVALDDRYFYVADRQLNKVYIWEGIPADSTVSPKFTWDMPNVTRIDTDSAYLAVNLLYSHTVKVFRRDDIGANPPQPYATVFRNPQGTQRLNLPEGVAVGHNMLMIADTGANRVQVWSSMQAAADNRDPDIVLGKGDLLYEEPRTTQNRTFWPAAISYDGTNLWVGEYKFSNRLLRFTKH